MRDAHVGADDARQAAHHEVLKSTVEERVNAEIVARSNASLPSDDAKVSAVAGRMRERAIDDTAMGERVLGWSRRTARGSQYLDYAFYLLYSLLGIRLVLALIGAQPGNGFVRFIAGITAPFYGPFRGIVSSPTAEGGFTLAFPIVIAIGVYALLHGAINAALRMVGQRKTEI